MQNGPEYKLCSTYPQLMYVPKEILVSVWLQMCADVYGCMFVQCVMYVDTACGCMFVQCVVYVDTACGCMFVQCNS